MKYIYYPEYELEYRHLLEKDHLPDHILNIRLLMLLCDHVILPSGHLLYTSSANILALISHLKDFFDAGKIITTQYEHGIDNYFISRIERISDPDIKRAKELQSQLIQDNLLTNMEVEHSKNSETSQLTLFDTRTRELITDFGRHKKKSIMILDRMSEVSDHTGEAVHSNQFKEIVTGLLNDGDLKRQQYNDYMNLMSNAYYYSGTYTMNALVSYNSYFKKIDLQNSLMRTHANAVNIMVDPYFLQNLFRIVGVDTKDILLLGVSDYKELMSHASWHEFMGLFQNIYESAQDLNVFLNAESKSMDQLQKKKKRVFEVLDVFFNYILLPVSFLTVSPLISIGVPLVIYLLRNKFKTVNKWELEMRHHTIDKILDRIQKSRDPLYDFCFRLTTAINSLR